MENLDLIIKNIGSAKRVAIVLPANANVDALCAAIALQAKLPGVAIFCSGTVPELPFLSGLPAVHGSFSNGNQLEIKISNRNVQPKELRYEKTDSGLSIFVSPDNGQFVAEDVSVLPAIGAIDLLVIIGAANFEQLGKLYTDNPKLFFDTPHINIDNNPSNELYGTINLVVPVASSLSEILVDILEGLPGGLSRDADGDIVTTALLAGIIAQTSSFRDAKTTPSALQKASRLVAAGARRKDIIQHLFKTKSLPLLQLWGRALARLTTADNNRVLTAVVTTSDLQKTGIAENELPIVLRDIIEMVTGFSLVVFLAETGTEQNPVVTILLAGLPYEKLTELANKMGSNAENPQTLVGQYQFVTFKILENLVAVQNKLTQILESRS